MRHRIRIQPYVSPEVHRKLRAYASSRGLTDSAVAEAALAEYVDRDQVEAALVLRRVDALSQAVGKLQREQAVGAQALAYVGKFLFRLAAGSAPDAKAQAQRRYERLVIEVAEQLKAGVSLAGDVWRATLVAAPGTRPPTTAAPAVHKGR